MSLLSDTGFVTFFFMTLLIGGGAAAAAGRALARTWRPLWQVVIYSFLLAIVTRFFYFALFGGALLSVHYLLVNAVIIISIGLISFRLTRVRQMVTQYPWAYKRKGLFGWSER